MHCRRRLSQRQFERHDVLYTTDASTVNAKDRENKELFPRRAADGEGGSVLNIFESYQTRITAAKKNDKPITKGKRIGAQPEVVRL